MPLLLAATAADAVVPVAKHTLSCGTDFPCPKELRRRTDFWIQVYSKWDSTYGVLHDSLHPERVYAVVKTPNCSFKQKAVKRERERLKKRLASIAATVEKGAKPRKQEDREILALFPKKSPGAIRAAAKRIRCQQGNRDRFKGALERYGTYGKMVNSFIVDAGLPTDIHYLPFVESLYNPRAYSRVGAAGLWQIMPSTARVLGLELNATVDERLDLEMASIGAARYLIDARRRLTKVARAKNPSITDGELTPFVITSYNYGVNGMRRALQQFGPDFIKVLNNYKSPSFQVAVKNFYSSFLAARHVAKNARKFFGVIKPDPSLRYNTVVLQRDTSIERIQKVFRLGEDELRPLNRALTRFVWHGWRLVPKGYRLRLPLRQDQWASHITALRALPPEDDSRRPTRYVVRKGDTACGIARAFRVKCKDVVDINRLGRRAFITVGQTLVIPGRNASRQSNKARVATAGPGGTHVVKKGEVPCGIASRYRVGCLDFLDTNGLTKQSTIYVGQVLKIPGEPKTVSTGSSYHLATYQVKRGDTACEIAERVGAGCEEFMRFNGLGKKSVLQINQTLKVPGKQTLTAVTGVASRASAATSQTTYKVRSGDTSCQIAERVGMPCAEFLRFNNLRTHSVIYVGQILKIPALAIAGSDASAPAVALDTASNGEADSLGDAATSPLDNSIDLNVNLTQGQSGLAHLITVEAEETLGHYADWLGIGSSMPLRQINKIPVDKILVTGQTIQLPIKTDRQLESFQQRRQEYHRVLVEEFKEHYRIVNVESYQVRSGDSPWGIADRFQLPFWVITRYNPELRKRSPNRGEILKIPQVKPRKA